MRHVLPWIALSLAACGVALPANDQFLSEHDVTVEDGDVASGLDVDVAVDSVDVADVPADLEDGDVLDANDAAETSVDAASDATTGTDATPDDTAVDASDASDTTEKPDAVLDVAVDAVLDAAPDVASDAAPGTDSDAAADVPPDVWADLGDDIVDVPMVDVADAGEDDAMPLDAALDGTSDTASEDAATDTLAADLSAEDAVADVSGVDADVLPACDPVLCPDDANPCTAPDCDGNGQCVLVPIAGTCDDADACTKNDTCVDGQCTGTPLTCDDGNACTDNTCNSLNGCSFPAQDGLGCSDTNPCTVADACTGGTCVSGAIKTCPSPSMCHLAGACDSGTGDCTNPVALDGAFCTDGLACTDNACLGGQCQAAAATCVANAACVEPAGCACKSGFVVAGDACVCPPGYLSVAVDSGSSCVADFPAWGDRPESPDPAWFVIVGDGTVVDTQTTLTWQQGESPSQLSWTAANAYCQSLVLGDGGKSNWRLPSVAELQTLIDYQTTVPLVPQAFKGTTAGDTYWALGTAVGLPTQGWSVAFNHGQTNTCDVTELHRIRCVADGLGPVTSARFSVPSAGTVLDAATGLTWQRDGITGGTLIGHAAEASCAALNLGPAPGGWRLPTIVELGSLVDRSQGAPTISPTAFPMTASGWYWSSTKVGGDATQWASIRLDNGWSGLVPPAASQWVRCVRGACGYGTCDDANACTLDSCGSDGVCAHAAMPNPPTEVCNGADDDCDGQIDDGVLCDDADPCTVDSCDPVLAGCLATPKCLDASPCTFDVCDAAATCSHPARLFDVPHGGSAYDMGFSLTVLADGYLLSGKSRSFGDGSEDGVVVRTDAGGKKLWQKTFGGTGDDGTAPIVQLSDGFAIGAWTNSKGAGATDLWLIRTDLDGNAVWDKTYGGVNDEVFFGMIAAPNGYVIGGSTYSKGNGMDDAWMVRTDASGTQLWDKAYGGGGWDEAHAFASLTDGFAFAGINSSKGAGGTDAWLVRTDSSGNVMWDRTYGGTGEDYAWGLTMLTDGFAFAGLTTSKGAGGTDIWVVRTDAQGQKLWDRTYGGADADAGGPIVALTDGFMLGGYKSVNGSNVGYLVRTTLDGVPIWERTYLQYNTGINQVVALPDGFAAIGWTMEKGAGDDDYWLLRTDAFGHMSCAESGTCLAKSPDGCDDGNACTADACDPIAGCKHAALAEWSVCGTGSICNGSGSCADAKAAKGMVRIPAGSFWMGCNSSKDLDCQINESPQHFVTLSGYYMDLTETTVDQYKACVTTGGCSQPQYVSPDGGATYPNLGDHPVNHVTWQQAQQYCSWRGDGFDLPTEAQWEMAARGRCEENGSTASDLACKTKMRTYPWGEATPDCTRVVFALATAGCGTNATFAVGAKTAGDSPFSVHDLAGNLFEWVRDGSDLYAPAEQFDPVGPASGGERVNRGGSFIDGATLQRTSFRGSGPSSSSFYTTGFRCARSYP